MRYGTAEPPLCNAKVLLFQFQCGFSSVSKEKRAWRKEIHSKKKRNGSYSLSA